MLKAFQSFSCMLMHLLFFFSLPEASQESSSSETEQHYEVVDPMVLLSQDGMGAAVEGQHGAAGSLEALFPPMLDIPPDADDETMVELAIALSLQVSLASCLICHNQPLQTVYSPIFSYYFREFLFFSNFIQILSFY